MKSLPVKLIIVLCLHIIGFIALIKLGYFFAEAPYYPFWGVDYSKRFLTLGGVMAVCFALSFMTFKIKQPADKEQKCIFWITYAVAALLTLGLSLKFIIL